MSDDAPSDDAGAPADELATVGTSAAAATDPVPAVAAEAAAADADAAPAAAAAAAAVPADAAPEAATAAVAAPAASPADPAAAAAVAAPELFVIPTHSGGSAALLFDEPAPSPVHAQPPAPAAAAAPAPASGMSLNPFGPDPTPTAAVAAAPAAAAAAAAAPGNPFGDAPVAAGYAAPAAVSTPSAAAGAASASAGASAGAAAAAAASPAPSSSSSSAAARRGTTFTVGGGEDGTDASQYQAFDPRDDTPVMAVRDCYAHGLSHREYVRMGKYESLDYHNVHNDLSAEEQWATTRRAMRTDACQRVVISAGIGLVVGCVAFLIHYVSEAILKWKYELLEEYLGERHIAVAYFVFLSINLALAVAGTLLILVVPAASGSGIPDVKGYLNGIRLPKAINVKTFLVKVVGTISHVSSSLPCGPEGPMIHIGAMVGGGVSQPRSKTMGVNIPFTEKFCTDKDRRDFISLGAACGVSAAFGAPLGGILFSLEEASSFWSQTLTWRTFLASMIATLTNNFFLSGNEGSWGLFDLNSVVVFNIGRSDNTVYRLWELIPFALIGAFGGLMGAAFIWLNVKVMKWRRDFIRGVKKYQVLEVVVLSVVVSTLYFSVPFAAQCKEAVPVDSASYHFASADYGRVVRANFTCENGEYNPIASLMFEPQSTAVRNLFSRGTYGSFGLRSTGIFWFVYTVTAALVAGSTTSAGLLVPILLAGAAYGRFCGIAMRMITGKADIDPGIYALIGASAFFGGVTRMTISLCVIMLEITNDLQFLPPIMMAVMSAKLVGDLLNHPLYDMALVLKYVPFLEAEPSHAMERMNAGDVMTRNVQYFPEVVDVGTALRVLHACTHNGFPVVDVGKDGRGRTLKGLITRKQLAVLIKTRAWENNRRYSPAEFRALMALTEPTARKLESLVSDGDKRRRLNLVPYMNRSPFSVHSEFNAVYAFRLFRSMGLRHLPVVSAVNDVVGMITRKDLIETSIEARFRRVVEQRGANLDALEDDFLPGIKSAQLIASAGDAEPVDDTVADREQAEADARGDETPAQGGLVHRTSVSRTDSADGDGGQDTHYHPLRQDAGDHKSGRIN